MAFQASFLQCAFSVHFSTCSSAVAAHISNLAKPAFHAQRSAAARSCSTEVSCRSAAMKTSARLRGHRRPWRRNAKRGVTVLRCWTRCGQERGRGKRCWLICNSVCCAAPRGGKEAVLRNECIVVDVIVVAIVVCCCKRYYVAVVAVESRCLSGSLDRFAILCTRKRRQNNRTRSIR